jgi:hypothetical protein
VLAAAVQKPLAGDKLKFGVEGGGIFSFKTDRWIVDLSNGNATIHIENSSLLADLFFGGFAATDIGQRLRVYAGAGPLIIFGHQKIEPDHPEIDPYHNYYKSSVSDWDVGIYGRAGFEFRFTEEYSAGFGVRWMESRLEFEHPGGKTDIKGLQALLTLSVNLF